MDELHFIPLEDVLADYNKDPVRRQMLIDARKRLAPILYPEGGPIYERLMRGEGPSDSAGDVT